MKYLNFLLFVCLIAVKPLLGQDESQKLETALFNLPDVQFKKISAPCETPLRYELKVRQLLDQSNPSLGQFYQKVILIHTGFQQPVVMNTQGYTMNLGRNEVQAILNANYLNIEHRFFGDSKPDSMQWKYLTLENACADLHHINQLFRQIYSGKWVSTGISKGGQTTIYYRYFYPDDVDASIPYVAPINNSLAEKRIYAFFDTVGTKECRNRVYEFQKRILQNRDQVLPKLDWYARGQELTFTSIGSLEKAFEYAVLEFSFSFYQLGHDCSMIPLPGNIDNDLAYLLKVSNVDFFSDKEIKNYEAHYYMAATQMGYYAYQTDKFKPYLKVLTGEPTAILNNPKVPTSYHPDLNVRLNQWLNEKCTRMIHIHGMVDTWSATRITPPRNSECVLYYIPGKDHRSARIKNMPVEMQLDFKSKLQNWLGGIPIDLDALNPK